MALWNRRFKLADTAQQIVGGFLLAGPFVVTDEVWWLASTMSDAQGAFVFLIVLAVGYGALYKADERDPDREPEVGGVPSRYVSLILVAYLSVLLLAVAFNSPWTFIPEHVETVTTSTLIAVTLRAASVSAVFSVIGAATADSVF